MEQVGAGYKDLRVIRVDGAMILCEYPQKVGVETGIEDQGLSFGEHYC